jgi:hypothetical protein
MLKSCLNVVSHCKGISSVKVTGGNKGVGYAVVKKLLKKFRGVVYLTGW